MMNPEPQTLQAVIDDVAGRLVRATKEMSRLIDAKALLLNEKLRRRDRLIAELDSRLTAIEKKGKV